MLLLTASPILRTLGWALLNSVWQFAIVWLLYAGIITILKNISAAAKHRLAVYALASGTLWFFISLVSKYFSLPDEIILSSAPVNMENLTYYNIYSSSHYYLDALTPWISVGYLACVAFLFSKFFLYLRHAEDVRNHGISKMPVEWRMYVRKVAAQLGIEKEVTAVLSARIDTPQVIGVLRPMILVPVACLNHMTTLQLEAVLLHELVHIRRNDYFINLYIASIEILFFFNPFVKQLVISIRREREYSCDDMVLQFQYQPQSYAGALLTLEQNRKALLPVGIAANGNHQQQLLARISRIVGVKGNETRSSRKVACLLTIVMIAFVALINPVKVAVLQFNGPAAGDLVTKLIPTNTISENNPLVYKIAKEKSIKKISDNKALSMLDKLLAVKIENGDPEEHLLAQEVAVSNNNEEAAASAVTTTTIDFSLPETNSVAPSEENGNTLPYVPNSSYSYQYIPDTSHPKLRGESYQEKLSRISMLNAQKAIEEIDWGKLNAALKQNKAALNAIKKHMTEELAKLNWQKINQDVKDELRQEQEGKMQERMMQQQVMQQYKQAESYNEALQKQLQEKEQFLKDTEKRTQDLQRSLQEKDKKLQEEMRKKRIIYI